MNLYAVALALASAALFGLSTPASKALIGTVHPTVLAGLLYLGAGVGVAVLRRMRGRSSEAPVTSADVPWIAGAILCGGVVAPILLMFGLARTDAATASLFLTLEGVATALLAWFAFHESFDRRIALGMVALVSGAAVLAWSGTPSVANLLGPLAIVGACVAWGLDNNLTRKVSLSDPLHIVELKGLIAGPATVIIGLVSGGSLPPFTTGLIVGAVGFLGIGISLVLYVKALRDLGTARTGAYFSTAPFLGAVASILLLKEPLTAQLLCAGGLMALGVWLHLTENHEHEHVHESMEHTHAHVHDAHHQHTHAPTDPPGEPHSHRHVHVPLRHQHAHVPDMHHTHRH